MKRLLSVIVSMLCLLAANPCLAEPATKEDIRLLIEQMDKRFDAVQTQMDRRFDAMQAQMDKRFEQMERRFEQVDKRFEQMNDRFEFIQALMLALFAASVGTPFLVERYRQQRGHEDETLLRGVDRLLAVMRDAAQHEPRLKDLLVSARLI